MRGNACPGSASLGRWAETAVIIAMILATLALCTQVWLSAHSLPGTAASLTSQDTSGRFLSRSPSRKVHVSGNFSK